jgi:hypothetical protein
MKDSAILSQRKSFQTLIGALGWTTLKKILFCLQITLYFYAPCNVDLNAPLITLCYIDTGHFFRGFARLQHFKLGLY